MQELMSRFDKAMYNIYTRAIKETSYKPTGFLQMLERQKGLATAKQLINATKPSDGYTRLYELDRLDLSVEAVVIENSEWHELFSEEELSKAKKRLKEYRYL